MPRGMSMCRYCGKLIPSLYKRHHETHTCREMRRRRRETLPQERAKPEPEKPRGLDPWMKPDTEEGDL